MPDGGEMRVVWLDDRQDIGMTFCWIPPGEFRMGSRDGDTDEQPVHRVIIENGFWLGRTPVTQRQYAARFPEHENHFHGQDDHPAESMTWHDARHYCQWLSEKRLTDPEWRGWSADLPGETQWEYACRAGTETDYYTGDGKQALARAGWYGGNTQGMTHEVWQPGRPAAKYKAPNALGLYDMHGNVWEWCRDVWSMEAYRHCPGHLIDPLPVADLEDKEDSGTRVIRGGAWDFHPGYCRSASRIGYRPGYAGHDRGFRVGLFPGPSCPGPEAE